jgi:chemotaxis protein methyltransferase CheR
MEGLLMPPLEQTSTSQLISEFNNKFKTLSTDRNGFEKIAALLLAQSGISLPLNAKNLNLVASRLVRVLDEYNFSNYNEYIYFLNKSDSRCMQEFINALTTNTTNFFRESKHFDVLANVYQSIRLRKMNEEDPEVRIWCAASSRGQEAYTILMTLFNHNLIRLGDRLKLLASDIDIVVLQEAARGVYKKEELKEIPPIYFKRFFKRLTPKIKNNLQPSFQIINEVRDLVTFAPLNLMKRPYPFLKKFDVIFCRNVLIYFNQKTATEVTEYLCQYLNPEGYLFVGHTETGLVNNKLVKSIAHGVYQRHER